MWIQRILWLSLFSPGVLCLNYYLEGHLDSISAEDVTDLSPDSFIFLENKVQTTLEAALQEKLQVFFVDKFEIHGESGSLPTAIFLVYFESSQERDRILKKVVATPFLSVFYLSQIDQLPQRSQALRFAMDDGVDSCTNGGILLPNRTCACPAFFTGARCEIIQCLHQGIADSGACFCPPGVYSMNCEPRSCVPLVQNTLDNSQKTLMLVVNTKTSQAYVLNYLFTQVGGILDQMNSNNSTAYFNYILTTYVTGTSYDYMKTSYFTSSDDLVNYLLGVVSITDGVAVQPTNRALLQTQSSSGKMKAFSNIFVFTDSLDSEAQGNSFILSANTSENNLILKTIAWRNKIVYFLGQTAQSPMDTGDRFSSYRRVAQSTLGEIIPYNLQDIREIQMIIKTFLPIYQNVEVNQAWYTNVQNVSVPIFTDYPEQMLWLLVTVEPDGTPPTVTFSGSLDIDTNKGTRFMFYSLQNINGSLSISANGSPWSAKVFMNSFQTVLTSYSSNFALDVGDAYVSDVTSSSSGAFIGFPASSTFEVVWEKVSNRDLITLLTFSPIGGECAFPYDAFGSFSCSPGPFLQYATVADTYHRILPGYCIILDRHFPPPFVCLNGGINNSSSSCACPPNLKGDHCEIPICLAGGTLNPFPGNGLGLCTCPYGYSGQFCDNLFCTSPSTDSFDNTARSFGIVLQTSMSQSQIAGSIGQGLSVMLNMITGSDAFKEYLLTTFNTPAGASGSVYSTAVYQTPDAFKTAVSNVSYLATSASTFDSFSALFSAMMRATKDRSSFFLFVDSPPSATLQEMDIAWYAIAHEHEISVIITPPYNMPELCIQDISAFLTIVQKTGGVIYNLCSTYTPNGLDPIVEFFRGFGSTHHHTENIAEYLSPSCRALTTLSFFVDDPTDDVFLIVNSQSTQNFTVTFSNNDNPAPFPLAPISNTPFLAIYSIPLNSLNQQGYIINVSDGAGTIYGGCFSRIVSKTTVAAYIRFSNYPSQDSYTNTLTYATETFPVVHLSTPIEGTVYITALDNNGFMHYYSPDTKRNSSCRYESYFRVPLICDSVYGTFIMTIKTAPPGGGVIQRSRRTLCYLGQQTCLNGGQFTNGRCSCPAGRYQGPYCEYPICQNGAELNEYQCVCGSTRAGPLCELETCKSWNYLETVDPRETDYKQITFIINVNRDQLLTATFISTWIQQYVDDTSSGIPKLYSLITFDDQTVTDVATTPDKDVFVQIVQSTIKSAHWRNATSSRSLDAINEAFKINIDPPAIIYLFTGTDAARSSVVNTLIRERIGTQVNIIYSPQNQQYPGQPGGPYGAYLSIAARQSGGRIWPLTQNGFISLEYPLSKTVLENALVFDDAQSDCSQGVTFSFFLDTNFTAVYFDISGRDIAVVINNSNGDKVPITAANILLTDSALLLLSLDGHSTNYGGNWSVTVTTTSGSCYLQVREVASIRVVLGFTSDQNNDFVKELPFLQYGTNKTSYMTFRLIDNWTGTDSETILNRVDISSGDFDKPWSGRQALQSLNIRPRTQDGCASQYVSDLWKLDKSTTQKFVVYGSDDTGQFQRTFFYSFSTADSASTCYSGGTRNVNGECICDAQHSGDYCMDRVCQNGGSQSYGVCICPNGYYGDYCEKYLTYGNVTTVSPTVGTTASHGMSTRSPSTASATTQSSRSITIVATTVPPGSSTTPGSTVTVGSSTSAQGGGASTTINTSPSVTTTSANTKAPSTVSISTTTTAKTTVSTVGSTITTRPTASTSPTPAPICDPHSTRYMVSLFLDATNILPDPASGTYSRKEAPIVQLLAQKLELGRGVGNSRFVFNGVSSNYTYCGNVTNQDDISGQSSCLDNGIDMNYDLELALSGYLTMNYWQLGAGEKPAIGVIFSATQILDGIAGSKYYIDQLQSKNYTFLGVDVSTDGSLLTPLTTLVGEANVYRADGADSTSTWLKNRICQIKPF